MACAAVAIRREEEEEVGTGWARGDGGYACGRRRWPGSRFIRAPPHPALWILVWTAVQPLQLVLCCRQHEVLVSREHAYKW